MAVQQQVRLDEDTKARMDQMAHEIDRLQDHNRMLTNLGHSKDQEIARLKQIEQQVHIDKAERLITSLQQKNTQDTDI